MKFRLVYKDTIRGGIDAEDDTASASVSAALPFKTTSLRPIRTVPDCLPSLAGCPLAGVPQFSQNLLQPVLPPRACRDSRTPAMPAMAVPEEAVLNPAKTK